MTKQDLLVVVNAAAGSTNDVLVEAAMSVLRDEAAARQVDVEIVTTNHLDELAQVLGSLAGRRLVVLGGDGTLQATVQHLYDDGSLAAAGPIGIVPLGTGNDLAKYLGVPDDPAAAARIAVNGVGRAMELLVGDDGHVTVNSVHVGVGAAAASKSDRVKGLLTNVGLGRLGYRIGALAAGATEPGRCLKVMVDGNVVHDGGDSVLMVAIGVGPTVGGGAPLVPDANPFDGELDVVVSLATGPVSRIGFARGLKKAEHVERPDVLTARGRVVKVEALGGDEFDVDADGEVSGPYVTRRWEVRPKAWQMVVPKDDA